MPEEKGLYWVRVGSKWYLVYWKADRSEQSGMYHDLTACTTENSSLGFLLRGLPVNNIQEWGARVVEPGEG